MTVKEQDQILRETESVQSSCFVAVEKETPLPPKVFGGLHFMRCMIKGLEH